MGRRAGNTFETTRLSAYLAKRGIKAMDLVRLANVSVTTAYRITKGEPLFDLDMFYNVYIGLKDAGYEVTWDEIVEMP